VGVEWPLAELDAAPVLSAKDAAGRPWAQCELYELDAR
jgi:hypothetical protein